MTRAAFAAGAPAPEVFEEVTVERRFGIVLARLDGPSLRDLSRSGVMTPAQVGAILATLAVSVHRTPAPACVVSLRDWMEGAMRPSGGGLPESLATGVLSLIDRLSPGDQLCHCDLHSGNVIMTAEGPRLVDWTGAMRAPAALDLAVCHILHAELLPEFVDDPERPRAVGAVVQSEYARLSALSPEAMTAAIEPYFPIVRVLALLAGWAGPGLRTRLIQQVETALCASDLS
jgi:Ser/Thr protein kinase RdoA (MazF antagonist)